ncbi:hypothetical protein Rs2_21513 [Raphanus sativus]|nr:hypothetical protein Rs2_21513 [Raphanus sativus]
MHVKLVSRELRRKLFGRSTRSYRSRSRSRSLSPRTRESMTGVILLTGSLVTGTEMASFTGMEVGKGAVRGRRGTVQGGDMEALLDEEGALVVGEKEARRGGQGLSNGTENGRRRKREELKKKNINAMQCGGFCCQLLCGC